MKKYIIASLFMLGVVSVNAQVMTPCLTMEQSQAQYNQQKANAIVVNNTASQQLQCYYQQLATYYQQKDKDNQQIAKDIQQIAKDKQQIDQDAALKAREATCVAREKTCAEKEAQCAVTPVDPNPWISDGCGGYKRTQNGELWTCNSLKQMFVDGIPLNDWLRMRGECGYAFDCDFLNYKKEYKAGHANRSGGADGTNPGGGGNLNGYLNPHN